MKVIFDEILQEIEYLQGELEKIEAVMVNTSDNLEHDRLKLYATELESQILSCENAILNN